LKFAHIADTHIRNLKYHPEYREIFSKIFSILREQQVDCIVHCGDLAHTKTQLSPEYFDMAQWFLKNLADIAPTYVIPGNHDGNLKNSSRQDAITPIAEALAHPNLHLLKASGETKLNDQICLNVLSVFDEDNWHEPTDLDIINIALHHGSISGCKTDQNWVMEYGEHDISIFKDYDYVFLGDIHKTNQILDDDGRVRYPGSTVQQNHGETNDKGFLVWDIQDKTTFSCEHFAIPNPRPFITVELTPKGKLPRNAKVPENARLRVVSRNNLPLNVLKKAVEVAKTKFQPESVTFVNKATGNRGNVENLTSNLQKEDLRDIGIQEKFICQYLKDYEPTEEALEKVLDLNKRYNSIVEEGEDVIRNVNWKIESVEWDNLFNYGENNKINFENLEGIVGVFGKNYSGKSSVIDSILYTMFDKTSKNNRKNLDVINQNKDFCKGVVKISIGNNLYTVERRSEKYLRTLHGKTTEEAKTNVEFSKKNTVTGVEEELNGLTRQDTDKKIRKVFGTFEDFLLTSMASQIDSLSYIKEGSVKRKEILAKFLDLEIFDKKYKLAKEEGQELRSAIKRLEEKEFDTEITEAEENLEENHVLTKQKKKECNSTKKKIEKCNTKLVEIDKKIDSIPAQIINCDEVREQLESKQEQVKNINKTNSALEEKIAKHKEFLEKVDTLKNVFNIDECIEKRQIIVEHKKELERIHGDISYKNKEQDDLNQRIKLLEEVPCGSEFSHCKFIKNAYDASEQVDIVAQVIKQLETESDKINNDILDLDPETVDDYIEKYKDVTEKEQGIKQEVSDLFLTIEKNKSIIVQVQTEIEILTAQLAEYEKNREAIENLEKLIKEKRELNTKIKDSNLILGGCEKELLQLHKTHGSLEQQLQNLQDQQEELDSLRQDYAAYDLYEKCMRSKDGIPYDIIKNKLPVINEEISKILSNIVEFDIFFETSDKKLEIYIKHSKYGPRPIELGSGAEKTIAAMAIRLSLLSVSNLPKADLFVLDEPGTSLDEDNMEGFIRILTDMIKTQFKTVLLISHLDSLKDCVDTTIEIDKRDGLAHISQ
jgi:DNA repair exonuclease SbcCD ATPase subunit/predicted MPP superfamily phosphohydrolase|tara:strand:- start:975 stop:4133 length:3159 start_codon:yes stop_codon:yes gene_type:complete